MLSPEANYLVSIEQHHDRLRRAERAQLLKEVGLDRGWMWHKSVCRQLGRALTLAGAKLEQYGSASPRPTVTLET